MNPVRFAKIALQDFKVGAVTASSRYAARRVAREIKPGQKFIVEYGPGDGVVIKEILDRLPLDGRLIVIELNKDFLHELNKIDDSRLKIVSGDVVSLSENLAQLGLPRIDAVVSGIPFSLMSLHARQTILRNTYTALAEDGIFLIYQHSPFLLALLERWFKSVRIHFELRNFPPYFIMVAEKG